MEPTKRAERQQAKAPQHRRNVGRHQHLTQLFCAVLLVVLGVGLLIVGFIVPPIGEIHPSVLVAFGEILTFVGAIFGIDYHYKLKQYLNGKL